MTDLQSKLMDLHNVVTGSGIINSPFNTHEVINGKGRRLGLKNPYVSYRRCYNRYQYYYI